MTIHSFAADLADRIPEMARDGKINNQKLIEQLLKEFLTQLRHTTFIPEAEAIAESDLPTLEEIQAIYKLYDTPDCDSAPSPEKTPLPAPPIPAPGQQTDYWATSP